jgi:xanthine dehydrogenase YagS FAD-binding subunit
MKCFTYYRPSTAEDAIGLLEPRWGNAELLAGGTDLIGLQKDYVAQPEKVISLGSVASLSGIKIEGGKASIGAGTKLAEMAEHADIRKQFSGLATAAADIGGPQIRNMGTLGGNLCQRNRCWYFRDEQTQCLLKGGDKCFALDGDNRYHAIFTLGHPCVIVSPSTLAPILIALGATAEILGPKGKRALSLDTFFRAPRSDKEREHVLAPNEMVLSVAIPCADLANASYEVRHKLSYDWPLVQAAVAFKLSGGKATGVKIILGHAAPTPHVAAAAAQAMEGKEVTEESAAAAGKAAAEGAKPLAQNGYKTRLVEVAVKRALLTAAGQKKYWEV